MKFYLVYKNNGLYDPVLDDQEPIYYEPEDLDPQSQPTEVPFKIQKFLEPEDLGSKVINYENDEPLGTPFDPSVLLVESRSLTASPYVNPSKPYRPFSTEPVPQVPPLEDPIILNPDYKDQFGQGLDDINPDYILNSYNQNGTTSNFKLPISEQYDPYGKNKVKNVEIDSILSKYIKMEILSKQSVVTNETISDKVYEDVKGKNHKDNKTTVKNIKVNESLKETTEHVKTNEKTTKQRENISENVKEREQLLTENIEEKIIEKELKYIEQMKQDIDITQIENTAISVVEDSIERAVSVTEEIKKETNGESSKEIVSKIETAVNESEEKDNSTRKDIKQIESEDYLVKTETKQSNKVDKHLFIEEQMANENKSVNKELTTNIQDDKESNNIGKSNRKAEYDSTISEGCEESTEIKVTSLDSSAQKTQKSGDNFDIEKATKSATCTKGESSAQRRSYAIGLQTIPNIRGIVHPSYHYDLLLRTFFIHLTDVMVALSRFVLSQPVFDAETHENTSEAEIYEKSVTKVRTSKQEAVNSSNRVENQRVDESRTNIELKQKTMVKDIEKVDKPTVVLEKNEQAQKMETHVKMNENKIKKRELVTPIAFKENIMQDAIETLKMDQNSEANEVSTEKKIQSGSQMAQRTERKLAKDVTQKMDSVISEFQTIAVEGDKKEMFQRNRRSRSRSQIEEEVAKESDPLEWLAKIDSRRASQKVSEERLMSKKEYSSVEIADKKHFERQEIKHKKCKPPKQMYLAIVEAHVYTNKDVIFEDAAEFSETSSVQSAEEINVALDTLETMSTENVAIENAVQQIEHAQVIEESQKLEKVSAESIATVRDSKETVFDSNSLIQKEYKKESALQTTNVQEINIQESQKSIENLVVNRNESLSVAKPSEMNTHESKNEVTAITAESKHIEIVKEVVNVKPEVQIEEVTESVIVKSQKPEFKVGEECAALKIIKEVETEIETTNEIVEIEEELDVSQDINHETVVNKIEISKELELDKSRLVTEKSVISSENGLNKSDVSISSTSIINSETDIAVSNHTQMHNYNSESYISNDLSNLSCKDSSFTAKSVDKKLTLRTDLDTQISTESAPSTIDTPTPSTVPPTPLTDEYVFKLTIPLPKSRGSTPIPRDCTLSPQDEDPHIVKKKLIPHIETTIEKVIYDPPLPTPPGDKVQSPIYKIPGLFGGSSKPFYKPVYRKPGLFGGADNPEYRKEEIREIERKSSLLASAIDETIKSIEEYKEEVGIEKKKDVKVAEFKEEVISKSYQETSSENIIIESQQNGFIENNTKIDQVIGNNENTIAVSNNTADSSMNIEKKSTDKSMNSKKKYDSSTKENSAVEITESLKEINKVDVVETVEIEAAREILNIEEPVIEQNVTNDNNKVIIEEKEYINSSEITQKELKVKENGYKDSETESVKIKDVIEDKVDTTEVKILEEKKDPMLGFRPVVFDPEAVQKCPTQITAIQVPTIQESRQSPYITESGEVIGTIQGIVDGLEEPVLDAEVAKELGKPGISEQKIAELISGEAEMLREAHVMGLSRVINSHMHRADDSSVDFQKIKPLLGSLKDSEVLKALNEELARQKEEQKKKEEKKWTTFLQKPKRPVPKAKFGYHGWTATEQALVEEPYKVKIVKQAKPKVAPDYKPEDFETGPLPWEERAEIEASLPPVEPEEPILIPEVPEFLEAVDPLKESEVPDLEDTGIPLPPPKEPTPPPEEPPQEEIVVQEEPEIQEVEEIQPETEVKEDMENGLAEQLVKSVQSMVDPNATIEQQLSQMRAQLSALAQLPEVIQQTLELVSRQLNKMTHQDSNVQDSASQMESQQEMEVTQNQYAEETRILQNGEDLQNNVPQENGKDKVTIELVEDNMETGEQQIVLEDRRVETPQIMEQDMKMEKLKKAQQYKDKLEAEARQLKQRPTPRATKPKRMFGPLDPDSRPVVLPGGRRWRKTEDVYNEQLIAETLQAQSELLLGKTMGFESDLLPYDNRINFMKYEKPPVSLDHLQQSETYKLVHDMDQPPLKRVEMLTPVIAEADYRERCRSMTPSVGMKHLQIPQQFHP